MCESTNLVLDVYFMIYMFIYIYTCIIHKWFLDESIKFPRMHTTSFAVIAVPEVCIALLCYLDTPVFVHS